MTDIFDLQTEFMAKAGQTVTYCHISQADMYATLCDEESKEFDMAQTQIEAIKEACDCLVVYSGWLISELGTDKAKRAYDLVHTSNMAKLEGKIEKRDDGKVLKDKKWSNEIKAKLMTDLADLVGCS